VTEQAGGHRPLARRRPRASSRPLSWSPCRAPLGSGEGPSELQLRRVDAGSRRRVAPFPPGRRPVYNRGMAFVVKITSRTGGVCWLSAANENGFRTLATRESADLFQKYEDANIAIRKLPRTFKGIGRAFSVEPAD
jgi:hypothetical protein